jgi:hypothetical protein
MSNLFLCVTGSVNYVKLLLLFVYKHLHSGQNFSCAFVQDFDIVKQYVDEDDFDLDIGLPKVLLKTRFRILPVSSIVRPVRLIPNYRSIKLHGYQEYFVRYNIDYSGLVEKYYQQIKQ